MARRPGRRIRFVRGSGRIQTPPHILGPLLETLVRFGAGPIREITVRFPDPKKRKIEWEKEDPVLDVLSNVPGLQKLMIETPHHSQYRLWMSQHSFHPGLR